MFEYLMSFVRSTSALSPNLSYVSNRMDLILQKMLNSSVYSVLIDVFAQVGVVLLLVYFAIDLLDKVSDVQFNLEIFVREFVKLIVAYAIMTHLSALLKGACDVVMAINQEILAVTNASTSGYWANVAKETNTYALGDISIDSAGMIWKLVFLAGSQIVMQFLTWTLSVDRALKIGYKSIMAPIACADMITNGMQSTGIRYIKSIIALYLQSTVMLIIMFCINEVCANMEAGAWGAIVGLFILWNVTKSSAEIAEEII